MIAQGLDIDTKADNLHTLLEYVRKLRAIDFNAYRPGTIKRRLEIRLSATGMPDYASYLQYIEENPKEIDALIDTLTIKVSHFFRNSFVFEVMKSFILPELIDTHRGDALRIWCAGCARGEEAYSVAILLKEVMGKEKIFPQTFILATDIDRETVEDARRAVYTTESLVEVKKGCLDKYFTVEHDFYRLKNEIRSMVTFAYHDVTTCKLPKEGIFSDYHLILCRNVLIYFERDTQERVMGSLSGSILKDGYLVLGESETIPHQLDNFYEVMPYTKAFKKRH